MITKAIIQIEVPITIDIAVSATDEWVSLHLRLKALGELANYTAKDLRIVKCNERPNIVKSLKPC